MGLSVLFKEISTDLNLNLVQVGLVWSIGSLPAILTALFSGVIIDRVGPKRVMVFGVVMAAVMAALRGLAADFSGLLAIILLGGALSPLTHETGATAPALGSYPFMLYGFDVAAQHPFLFWSAATVINLAVGGLVVMMAYAVAFFGVSWPDRVVKSRLVKWIIRGPVTASVALGVMTIVRRGGALSDPAEAPALLGAEPASGTDASTAGLIAMYRAAP